MMEFFLGSSNNFLQYFERLAVLRKLGILNLGDKSFDYRIISSLNGLSPLKTLSLARNYFERWNKRKTIKCILVFSFSFFNRSITGFESLSILENLEILDLSHKDFNRTIIESLIAVKSLKNLNLGSNQIDGSFPAKGMLIFHITF
jgi:hypothetical protein